MSGSNSEGFDAIPQSPKHAPISPADDDLEPAEAQELPTPVLPAPLSPDYLANSEPIEDDPPDAEEDPEEEPSKEEEKELPALAASTLAIADPASPSEETEPFEEDEVDHTPPSPISSYSIIPLS
ncbi:hypothetical protein Tco_0903731 [Tanacetum coccineum]